jgi:hypothetical protein
MAEIIRDQPPPLVVKPARGLVRHPRTFRPIRDEGEDVSAYRGYFNRLLRTGDVVVVVPQPKREG